MGKCGQMSLPFFIANFQLPVAPGLAAPGKSEHTFIFIFERLGADYGEIIIRMKLTRCNGWLFGSRQELKIMENAYTDRFFVL